jgi:hypothetical protein
VEERVKGSKRRDSRDSRDKKEKGSERRDSRDSRDKRKGLRKKGFKGSKQ